VQGALELGRAREGAGFELVMGGRKVEQLDGARGIGGLAGSSRSARSMTVMAILPSVRPPAAKRSTAAAAESPTSLSSVSELRKAGFSAAGASMEKGDEGRQIETAHMLFGV
jgi:hypothetical protein